MVRAVAKMEMIWRKILVIMTTKKMEQNRGMIIMFSQLTARCTDKIV